MVNNPTVTMIVLIVVPINAYNKIDLKFEKKATYQEEEPRGLSYTK